MPRFPNALFMDLPGHGSTLGEPRRSPRDYALWVRDQLTPKGVMSVDIIGHSMGGAIAMEFALAYPELTRSITLVSTGAKLRVSPLILDGLRARSEKTLELIAGWSFTPAARGREVFMEIIRGVPFHVSLIDYEGCDGFDRMASIDQIRAPCLVVCGTEDRMTPPKYSQYLAQRISRSKLVIVPDAGHMVMMEQPDRFNEALGAFLSEVRRSP